MGKYMNKAKAKANGEVEECWLGVRTRAKTLALALALALRNSKDASYLQLRNRRLHKPNLCSASHRVQVHNNGDGENVLEVQGRDRGTRESTPCNFIRDPDIIRTHGSTTRSSGLTSAERRVQNSAQQNVLLASELDEIFTTAEEEQQKSFTEKYNFDPATDKPLLGRFEWEKMGLKK